MISINKCLALAVIASVLLSAAFVQADESEESTTDVPKVGGLGTKIIEGIRSAGNKIFSRLSPYLGSHKNAEEEATEIEASTKAATETDSAESTTSMTPEAAPVEVSTSAATEAASEEVTTVADTETMPEQVSTVGDAEAAPEETSTVADEE